MQLLRTFVLSFALAALAWPTSAASNILPPVETSFTDVLNLTADIYQAMDAKDRDTMNPKPVLLETEAVPCVLSKETVEGDTKRPAVHISSGMIGLLNYVSFVKAVQKVNKSYYNSSLEALGKLAPGQAIPPLNPIICPAKNQLDVSNEQMGYFNQMAGLLVSIDMVHHGMGYYEKYKDKLADKVPLNSLLTPVEYQKAVVVAANKALECGLGVEGLRALMDLIDHVPTRPDWTTSILPRQAKPTKIMRLLLAVENKKLKPTDAETE